LSVIFSRPFPVVVVSLLALTAGLLIVPQQPTWTQTSSTSSSNGNQSAVDPLHSWKNGVIKQRIIQFVQNVTDPSNAKYYTLSKEYNLAKLEVEGYNGLKISLKITFDELEKYRA